MFHVATHAFFKALLFLGAGSVLIALHHQGDIRQMGGLARALPITALTMAIGVLAIAGIPPLSGFWSKEAVLLSAYGAQPLLFWVGIVTALITAAYMVRLWWLVFMAPPASHAVHADRERYASVLGVLVVLAIGSVVFGWVVPSEKMFHEFLKSVADSATLLPASAKSFVLGVALGAGLAGIAWSLVRYRRGMPPAETQLSGMWGVLHRQYGYDALMRRLGTDVGGAIGTFLTIIVENLIDGLVILVGLLARGLGSLLRPVHSGYVRSYAFVMMLGALLVLVVVFVYGLR